MLIELYYKIEEYKNDVPFDEKQETGLKETLMVYIKEKGYVFSPETLLIFSFFSSILPNAVALRML